MRNVLRKIEFKITADLSGAEVKQILYKSLSLSSKLIRKLKTYEDGILLNYNKVTVSHKVFEGDILTVNIKDEASLNIVPNDIPLDIVYEDEDILAVNKPYNMPTHPSINHYEGTLANGVMNYYKDKDFAFRAVNRLDRDTTGIVLIAKNRYSAEFLSRQIRNGEIKKTYLAICMGVPKPYDGVIDAPIKRKEDSVITRVVAYDGQYAKTGYSVIKSENGCSLVKLNPETGRTHQIRVHMAHIGHPLYGDFIYGEEIEGERTRLHCRALSFYHPVKEEIMTLTADVPDDFFIR